MSVNYSINIFVLLCVAAIELVYIGGVLFLNYLVVCCFRGGMVRY